MNFPDKPLHEGAVQKLSKLASKVIAKTVVDERGIIWGRYSEWEEDPKPDEGVVERLKYESEIASFLEKSLPNCFRQGLPAEAFVGRELMARIHQAGSEGRAPGGLEEQLTAEEGRKILDGFTEAVSTLPRRCRVQFRVALSDATQGFEPVDLGSGFSLVNIETTSPEYDGAAYDILYIVGTLDAYFQENLWSWRYGSNAILEPVVGLLEAGELLTCTEESYTLLGHYFPRIPLAWVQSGEETWRLSCPEQSKSLFDSLGTDGLGEDDELAAINPLTGKRATPAEIAGNRLSYLEGIFATNPDGELVGERVISAAAWLTKSLVTGDEREEIVFLMTVFEALFGKGLVRVPRLDHRLADRLAHLLGRHEAEREEISEQFDTAYSLRSKILHQGRLTLESSSMRQQVIDSMLPLAKRAIYLEAKNLPRPPATGVPVN